jgi:hypothetical protein
MDIDFLIPFICLCVTFSWASCAKGLCEKNYDSVLFYDTPIWKLSQMGMILSIIIGIIIAGINSGFLIALAYLGIAIGTVIVNQLTLIYLRMWIFGYQGLGAVMPIIAWIASFIWLLCNA